LLGIGNGDKEIEKVYLRKKIFSTLPTRAAEAERNLFYRHDKSNELTKEGPLSLVLFESTFISVSTVSRGHPSL
jgi:hypothetical protein